MNLPDLSQVGAWLADVWRTTATFWGEAAAGIPWPDLSLPTLTGVPWWTVALVAALTLRALLVLGRGASGAAWRTVLAVLAGCLVVGQLVVEGADLALLPLHAVAAVVVALIAWERPHPEAAQLRIGRARRRRPPPWPRMVLLLAATATAVTASLMLPAVLA
jgi:hypothetical protein